MHKIELQKNHFKTWLPDETVAFIKDILIKNGILVEEKMYFSSSIDTISLRLVIAGTDIGANGKGINAEYATASAYAEFIERLANQHLNSFIQLERDNSEGFYIYPDEKIMSIEDLTIQNNPFLNFLLENSNIDKERTLQMHITDYKRLGKENTFISLPFWDCYDEKCVYMPYDIYRLWYGSNGMCAGNTPAEALVQGISELMERVAMRRIFEEKVALPEVPESYMRRFPYIYEKFKEIKQNKNYCVHIVDCSFGGEYPVAGLLLIEKNTGNYGLKLGCHPDFGIAMERTITEASQGQDIYNFTNSSFLDFSNKDVFSEINLAQCFMTGEGQYPYQFFYGESKYSFFEPEDVSKQTNEELLEKWIGKIQKKGYHVLIRNVSYLGFPVFHIIIPGLSETGMVTDMDYIMIHKLNHAIPFFRNPNMVSMKEAICLMEILVHYSYRQYMSFFMHTEDVESIPWENIGESVHYYQAVLSLCMGNFSDCIKYLTEISQKIVMLQYTGEDVEWLLALVYYVSAKQTIQEHQRIIGHMRFFFESALCDKLDEVFAGMTFEGFNNELFCKLVATYHDNNSDRVVEEIMKRNRNAMVGNMPNQCGMRDLWG